MNKLRPLLYVGSALLASTLLGACASVSKAPEQSVTERANERLELIMVGDFQSAYGYLSPGYRSSVSMLDYQRSMASKRIVWTDAKVSESDCGEDTCNLTISIEYEVFGAVPGVSRFKSQAASKERWLKSGSDWYFVPSN